MDKSALAKDLKNLVGERVAVSEFERWFYARDIMHIPRGVRALLRTMPDAVVRPENTEQVSSVVRYCQQQGLPVVPRGGGSSGLYGAVPKKGGVVLDLLDLNKVETIDVEQLTLTAGAGATWWQLEKELNRQDLTLRSYPSSARSATLGGWVMTSGLGIGSLKYGPVFEHVLSAEVVLPDGSIQEYPADQGLELFLESEGMLGIITGLTLRVRRKPDFVAHYLTCFDDIKELFAVLESLVHIPQRPYNIEFQDHRYLTLLQAAGYPVTDFGKGSGVLLVSFDGDKAETEQGAGEYERLYREHHGIDIEGAEHEWQERFNMLRVKRAVPNIVPSSAYVPLERLTEFYSGLEKLDKRPIGLMGYVVSEKKCNLMPLIVTDEAKPVEYLFAMQTPSAVSNLAIRLGGKPGGGIGVWNAAYRGLLGETRLDEINRARLQHDPKNIMNPGMWPEPPVLFQPVVYRLATGVGSKVDRLLPAVKSDIKAEGFLREIEACVQCGYCMSVCPTTQGWLSSTPRGRILMTKELFSEQPTGQKLSPEYLERIFQCTLCGRCGVDCSVGIQSRPMWQGVREYLVENGLAPESLKGLTTTIGETHNMAGKPNEQRANWVNRLKLPYDIREKKTAEVVYFVGCVASYFPMVQPAARAFSQIMETAGMDFGIVGGEEWCCGFPLMAAGDSGGAARCIRHNIERVKEMRAKTVVMTCPGCYRVWKEEYEEVIGDRHTFEVLHAVELLARLIEEGKVEMSGVERKITYHDPCDLGRNSGIFDEPRFIIDRIPGVELVELADNREYCSCCGSGGDLLASNQELAQDIARRKLDEVLLTGADTVVTACPSCIRALNMAKTSAKVKLNVMDITELLWKTMGS
jgi:Fe-S oxidoreductase/FAD/FMN-containing dehydrogenase